MQHFSLSAIILFLLPFTQVVSAANRYACVNAAADGNVACSDAEQNACVIGCNFYCNTKVAASFKLESDDCQCYCG
ncbi:hypothetical protein ACJQWK_07640 [Exserohilum turcicum]